MPSSPDASLLRIELAQESAGAELRLIGEMDLSTWGQLQTFVSQVPLAELPRVRLDLGGLEFCDATGIAEMLATRELVATFDHHLVGHGARPQLMRLLRMTRTTHLLG